MRVAVALFAVARVFSSRVALASQIYSVSLPADPAVGKQGERFQKAQTALLCR